jgi:hypothetical protein
MYCSRRKATPAALDVALKMILTLQKHRADRLAVIAERDRKSDARDFRNARPPLGFNTQSIAVRFQFQDFGTSLWQLSAHHWLDRGPSLVGLRFIRS